MIQAGRKILALIVLLFSVSSMAEVAIPPLVSRVTDLAGTLSADEAAQLEHKLREFETRKGSQIAVLIVPTTYPETIEQYSIRVVEAWKLGRKGVDDGILLLIAKQDRTVRLEVGYGLEGAVPDAIAKRITEEIIIPELKRGNFAGGIDAGIERIARVIEGEALPPPHTSQARGDSTGAVADVFLNNIIFVFIILLIIARILQSFAGRFIGATLTSAAAGFISWLIFSSVLIGIVAAIFAFFISLFVYPGGGISRGGRGGWPGGYGGMGGRGGFGGGGFGGGGFSGGGGGFGGGGASGRW